MKLSVLTCLSLAALPLTAVQVGALAQEPAREPVEESEQDPAALEAEHRAAYDALVEEYEQARSDLRMASKDEEDRELRKQLRDELKQLPITYYARFSAMADAGNGLALIWMIENTDKTDVPRKERDAHKRALFERLVKDHVGATWFSEAVNQLLREKRDLGVAVVEELAKSVLEGASTTETKAYTKYRLGELLSSSDDEDERARGLAWYERLLEDHPDHELAKMAEGLLFELKHLQVGMVAPDIVGEDFDGVEFKLSDYRGKVVMLDFWGDW